MKVSTEHGKTHIVLELGDKLVISHEHDLPLHIRQVSGTGVTESTSYGEFSVEEEE